VYTYISAAHGTGGPGRGACADCRSSCGGTCVGGKAQGVGGEVRGVGKRDLLKRKKRPTKWRGG
jgi:hypothetical protein